MIDPSDENTGLPPLLPPDESDTLWSVLFTTGQADALSPGDGEPEGCLVLSVRGLANGPQGPEWAQCHIAFKHGTVTELLNQVESYLHSYPED